MTKTRFYSYWTELSEQIDTRQFNNQAVQELSNELETVLGNGKLISLTSASVGSIVVTTIAYQDDELDKIESE